MSKGTKRNAKQTEEPKQRKKRSPKIKPPKQDEYFEDKRNLVLLHPNISIYTFSFLSWLCVFVEGLNCSLWF